MKVLLSLCLSLFVVAGFAQMNHSAMNHGKKSPTVVVGTNVLSSHYSVDQTVSRIIALLKKNHFEIKAQVDHQAIGRSLGHPMLPNKEVLFGKPSFEYPLIKADPQAALFVPLAVVVFQDAHHQTHISYWDPKTDILPLLNVKSQVLRKDMDDMSVLLGHLFKQAGGMQQHAH